ncbi:hypothetical protein Tco_1065413 [Tanacetum coccineum]
MGAPLPARIQPGSIDHVPFPTVGTCLGASLALREKARRVAWSESVAGVSSIRPGALIPHNEEASSISQLPILCSRRSLSSSAAPRGRSTLWQDQSPGQTNPPPRRIVLCPPDPYRAKELPGDP